MRELLTGCEKTLIHTLLGIYIKGLHNLFEKEVFLCYSRTTKVV